MTAALQIGEVADSPGEFFAPASTDMVDGLVAQYMAERKHIEAVDEFLSGDGFHRAIGYYIQGNRAELYGLRTTPATEKMFQLEGAIKALNASHWDRALKRTDVLDFMPAKRREEWFEQIEKMETPGFDGDTVRATLGALLHQRMHFLAEKVDGIFQALSRTHVTNQPEGFGKRLILTGVTNDYGGYGSRQTGHINDLRQVIAKFMGRDEPKWHASSRLVEIARANYRGEWVEVDGGALRIRCYKNGNAHLEVHPDMAWRLNQILAHLHPAAIPSEFRTAPKRRAKVKDFTLMERPLPFAVLELLENLSPVNTRRGSGWGGRKVVPLTANRNSLQFGYGDKDKHALAEAERVLAAIGGVKMTKGSSTWWEFDYAPGGAVKHIIVSGVIPDQKSYQFYPTPERLARKAVKLAEIGESHTCLEPSAGTGALAGLMPMDRTTCIEVSHMHYEVLRAKGFDAVNIDFLAMEDARTNYDRIIMNPPFDQGRWQAHTEAAAGLVKPGGRLVAILPSGAAKRLKLDGYSMAWHGPYENEFAGTSVAVTILVADKEAA